ncbi:hypothetical protein J0K78_03425 [Halobacillus sp. GSS1]|uniref:hypothetical protein n=1 Tax=unclassified Halobacillus TaxID=2636472 RepID=UPI001A8D49D2|nr:MULTISPECIES: hypothetical protein [unclassified Halobacillus]MBN9653305.1 hypothetical protein [Halobacillus sp. GSS1]MEC3884881.1 hypothetical protein [Halobacillus sp. HZG1]
MEFSLDAVILAAGIALAGYFIGDGLKKIGQRDPMDEYLDQTISEQIRKEEEK